MAGFSRIAVINPLKSTRPTGMSIAGDAVVEMVAGRFRTACRPLLDRWILAINDGIGPSWARQLCRWILVQISPVFFDARTLLIFTSHHAPAWRTGRHFIIIHDLIALDFPFQNRGQTLYFILCLPSLVKNSRQVIAISKHTSDTLCRHLPAGNGLKAKVIPSYSPRMRRGRDETSNLARRIARKTFLFVGARFPHKNLDLAIEAILKLRAEGMGVTMKICGCDRRLWAKEFGGIDELERQGALQISDYAGESELNQNFAESTALIYIPLHEGLGMPPIEALARGCPVICSDIPALCETCEDAVFYVDPHDANGLAALLRKMVSNELTAEMELKLKAANSRLEFFSKENIQESWAQFLKPFTNEDTAKGESHDNPKESLV